ncbi:uncharacterized protein LOC106165759 isoform X2 [Lingula anatina]|uniref:Uncharacterized protein LOC106165759 isoform X2 n=1 Tax=Lingula anatina TaxID=7574 RepID=A0A1S3INA8_LINAN|nr:uncharacterized protein LOC106165759 isoform X2 [Lingula anatina]|eukprot:XP_013399563.1 uncharacterized protein LOC106165759 isoform X2 [Lingula anatina]
MGAKRRVFVDEDAEVPGPPVPPDGGWGWVVVAASFMCNVVVDGVSFSFMIFMLEFMHYFESTAEQTAWAGSCLTGCYLLMGPITSALANRYGCRMVAISGAVMATVAFLLSTLTTNLNWLILTYGVIGGIGFGLIYLPAIVIVGFYFEKKRALATGIAVSGSGVGIIVFPMLSSKLVKEYHWRGGLVLVAGIVLQIVICAALFRPLDVPKRKKRKPIIIYRGNIMTKLIAEKKRQRTISTHSLDNTIITKDNRLIRNKDLVQLIIAVDETVHKKPKPRPSILPVNPADVSLSCTGQMNRSVAIKNKPLVEVLERSRFYCTPSGLNPGSTMSLQPHMLTYKSSDDDKEMSPSSGYSSTQSLPSGSQQHASSETEEIWQQHGDTSENPEEEEQQREDMARPLYRRDIFFNGSVAHLPQFQAAHNDLQQYLKSVTHVPVVHHNPIFDVIKEMLDLSLFKNITFPILCLSTLLSTMGFFHPLRVRANYGDTTGDQVRRSRGIHILDGRGQRHRAGPIWCRVGPPLGRFTQNLRCFPHHCWSHDCSVSETQRLVPFLEYLYAICGLFSGLWAFYSPLCIIAVNNSG